MERFIIPTPQTPICDFCRAVPVTASYECEDFVLSEEARFGSMGGWAACADCERLVDARDVDGLLDRCFADMKSDLQQLDDSQRQILRKEMEINYHAFLLAKGAKSSEPKGVCDAIDEQEY